MDNHLEMARAIFSTTAVRWSGLTEFLPLEVLARAPALGERSAMDCLSFLVRVHGALTLLIKA